MRALLQLGRNVHGSACNVEAKPPLLVNLPQPHQTAMHTNAKLNTTSARPRCTGGLDDVPGSPAGALGMILKGAWPAEHRSTAVPGIMDDQSAGVLDRIPNVLKPPIEERLGVL